MVKEIKAFEDRDGNVYRSRLEATKADAVLQLANLLGRDNLAFRNAVIAEALEIVEVLTPYVEELKKMPQPMAHE